MASSIRKYKDMQYASNTRLAELIDAGNLKEAEKEYQRLNKEFHERFPKELWDRLKADGK